MKVHTALHYTDFFFFEELYVLMFLYDMTTSQTMYMKTENSFQGSQRWLDVGWEKGESHSAVSYLLDLALCTIDIAS